MSIALSIVRNGIGVGSKAIARGVTSIAPPPPPNPNLLIGDNSDFAGGTVGDWAAAGDVSQQVLTTDPPAGFTHYLRLTQTGTGLGTTRVLGLIGEAGEVYRFSGWFRVNIANSQEIRTSSTGGTTTLDVDNLTWTQLSLDSTITGSTLIIPSLFSGVTGESPQVGDYIEATGLSLLKL